MQPDVAVVDLRMPDLDGSEVLNAVVRDEIPTRMLFLSTHTDSGMVYDLLARGAAGYLDKVSSAGEVCDAVVTVALGQVVLTTDSTMPSCSRSGCGPMTETRPGSRRGKGRC